MMLNVIEDVRNEFKVKLTDKFEEEVISSLNSCGGNIYIGVNDKGDIIWINGNIDFLQRTIKICWSIYDQTKNKRISV